MDAELEKRAAAYAAAEFVAAGMTVGLGTGSTVAHLLTALAERHLDVLCVATSVRTEEEARRLGLRVAPFDSVTRFDIAIDGTDQIDPAGWLVKGGGAAHTREKIVAAAADRFVVISDSSKVVEQLSAPIPVEVLAYGLAATLAKLAPVTRRDVPLSPDGGVILDYRGEIADPAELANRLSCTPGVIEHGLFPPGMVSDVLIARGTQVTHERR
ncbi:MAG: ribose-5-phosphate isomerase RpiA [Candidatus Nanopelagicales bacterium]